MTSIITKPEMTLYIFSGFYDELLILLSPDQKYRYLRNDGIQGYDYPINKENYIKL